jgi:hypothetical protein
VLRPLRTNCPSCGAPSIRLSRFSTRRREYFACPECGARTEKVIPPWPYHLANLALGIAGSLAVPAGFVLWLSGKAIWILWMLAALVVVTIGIHAWFGRIAQVLRADPDSSIYRRRFQNESFK